MRIIIKVNRLVNKLTKGKGKITNKLRNKTDKLCKKRMQTITFVVSLLNCHTIQFALQNRLNYLMIKCEIMKEESNMKDLTIIVPAYNSEDYLGRCLDTLIVPNPKIEIIIINDGSTDRTAEIGEAYQEKYPEQVQIVHKENGGHGSGVNAGLARATGRYVKVVDSDDWVGAEAYAAVLAFIDQLEPESELDMIISNYVYEKVGAKHKKVIEYAKYLPKDRAFSWDEVDFPMGKYFLMHSIIYRTKMLQEMDLRLPEHTFYVDNLFVFEPLANVRKMYYLNVDLYHYYIGREDQSVNEAVMIKRIDQQLFVNRKLIDLYLASTIDNAQLNKYMLQFLEIITSVSSVLLLKDGTEESLAKKDALWEDIREKDEGLHKKLRSGLMGRGLHLPGTSGKKTALAIYRLAQKVYGFN